MRSKPDDDIIAVSGTCRILPGMSVASRLPAFLLLGLALVAVALLIAGYGVAVGVGVIAGLMVGVAVIVAFMAIKPRAGSSFSFLTWRGRGGSPDQPTMDLIEQHGRDSMRVAGVDAGALRRVITVANAVEVGGARVELVALEIREDGGIATIVAHTRPPLGFVGHFIEVTVSDDAGTTYVASGQGSGGSSPGTSRHEIRFAPSPPERARTLIIHIEAFMDPFPGRTVLLPGPWEFLIALA
jgi:hypothetical protein